MELGHIITNKTMSDIFFNFWKVLKNSFFHLVYPTNCMYCHLIIDPSPQFLCDACSRLLELIDPSTRCQTCFNLLDEFSSKCQECIQYSTPFFRTAAAFDYLGPAATLVKNFKYGNQPYLAKGMGAVLFTQFYQLNWPVPDAIVPVPISWMRRLERGYNQSELLAKELGAYLNRPIWNVIKRRSGDFSQASQSFEQRKLLQSKHFYFNPSCCVENKTLLIVDDVMTTGSTLKRCGNVLMENHAGALYALSFCRTQLS